MSSELFITPPPTPSSIRNEQESDLEKKILTPVEQIVKLSLRDTSFEANQTENLSGNQPHKITQITCILDEELQIFKCSFERKRLHEEDANIDLITKNETILNPDDIPSRESTPELTLLTPPSTPPKKRRVEHFIQEALKDESVVGTSDHVPINYKRIASKLKLVLNGYESKRNCDLAKPLEPIHFEEALHPLHPRRDAISTRNKIWKQSDSKLSFHDWFGNYPIPATSRVIYLSEEEREQYRVEFVKSYDGSIKMQRNGSPFTSIGQKSNHGGKHTAIFVLSLDHKMYAGSHNGGTFHHSSFLAGAPVLAAGEIKTNDDGDIKQVTLRSNHYKPREEHFVQFLSFLQIKGVDLRKVNYVTYDEFEGDEVVNTQIAYDFLQEHLKKSQCVMDKSSS